MHQTAFTIYDLRLTIHYFFSPANCWEDCDLAILRQRCVEELLAPHVFLIKKDVHMRPQVTLFIHDSIAQTQMSFPQTIESFRDGSGWRVNNDLALPVREVG